MSRADDIASGLVAVHARLHAAASAAGRDPQSVRLIAVSKTMPPDDLRAAYAVGQRAFGENYAQELRDKRAALANLGDLGWHYIGPLQRNKVKYVAGHAALVHTVDSTALLDEIDRRAAPAVQDCLVQVNVAAEPQKHGVAPGDLPALLDHFSTRGHVRCLGLMLIPPASDDAEAARPHFAALRRLRDAESRRSQSHVELRDLSMGMSADLEVAVAEGATLVRVGSAIFGARTG